MVSTINATSTGVATTADNSGILKVQSNGVTVTALAWVNFNGTLSTPITPRAAYNVSSVTKNGTGDYTINFTNALGDANYSTVGSCNNNGDNSINRVFSVTYVPTTSAVRVQTPYGATNGLNDVYAVNAIIFGNS